MDVLLTAALADKIEGAVVPVNFPGVLNYTLREPYGVVAVLTPWNSPTFLTMQAATPALAAGNTVVIKPSEVTSASIIEAAKLAEEAGFPPGVVNVVTGERRLAPRSSIIRSSARSPLSEASRPVDRLPRRPVADLFP